MVVMIALTHDKREGTPMSRVLLSKRFYKRQKVCTFTFRFIKANVDYKSQFQLETADKSTFLDPITTVRSLFCLNSVSRTTSPFYTFQLFTFHFSYKYNLTWARIRSTDWTCCAVRDGCGWLDNCCGQRLNGSYYDEAAVQGVEVSCLHSSVGSTSVCIDEGDGFESHSWAKLFWLEAQ